ncbi:hypothetical protein FRC08_014390 [Ceratobasidium sp. 394]|nr:hypothetical protein FRC08_014390 [Ceratobasidium sp. 394]
MPERRLGRTDRQLEAAGLKECPSCSWCYKNRGFTTHSKTCLALKTARDEVIASASTHDNSGTDNVPTLSNAAVSNLNELMNRHDALWPPLPEANEFAATNLGDSMDSDGPNQEDSGNNLPDVGNHDAQMGAQEPTCMY